MAESDRVLNWLRSFIPSLPRTRESSDARADGSTSPDARHSASDSAAHVRVNDGQKQNRASDASANANAKAPIYVAAKRRNGQGDNR